MSKVLLTHGYFIKEDEKEQSIMRPYPPLGLLYISSYLEEKDIDHQVLDSTFSSFSEWKEKVLEYRPNWICFYVNLMTKLTVVQFMKWIKNHPELRQTNIVLGGPDVSFNWEKYLQAGADFIVIGEGEETLSELVLANTEEEFQDIHGIAFRAQNGDAIQTAARKHVKNIDELPMPARHRIHLNQYLEIWQEYHGSRTANVSTQRGCPFTCKWCSTAVYGQSYRRRSPELVVEELLQLKEEHGVESIWFVDDVFTVNYKWIKQLHAAFQKADLKINFECITRAERLNDTILELLKEMGCFRIWIGAESGSQKILDAMDRKVSKEQVSQMIQRTKAFGIEAGTFIMVGYPGEDEKDIQETIDYLKECQPTHFTITKAYPIKGTTLYQEIESKITTHLDWETSTDRDIDFKRTYPSQYYNLAIRRIVNEVNYSKTQAAIGKQGIRKSIFKAKSTAAAVGMCAIRSFMN